MSNKVRKSNKEPKKQAQLSAKEKRAVKHDKKAHKGAPPPLLPPKPNQP
ncbi:MULTISPECIES: hypothetical protein [Niveibacterium]|uniref:Uncharacterized protein n=1 Tax=Niveibacterium microcysteis TaxID=2811415 RepID=A0ABX7M867_9RHOO|nr:MULTISPECIES: hypothetical protein [Niveibacterium]QSI76849.1 hypothetical protein JY500_20770 [Niveibacterium microcysteis]